MSSPPPPCSICDEPFETDHFSQRSYRFLTVGEFKLSAETGCEHCKVIWEGINQRLRQVGLPGSPYNDWKDAMKYDIRYFMQHDCCFTPHGREKCFRASLHPVVPQSIADPTLLSVPLLYSYHGRASSSLLPQFAVGTTKTLTGAVQYAKRKLDECLSHRLCEQPQPARLPTRTIFVGSSNGEICLMEHDEEVEHYYALSHCWGNHQPIKTTQQSLCRHKQSIRWQDLPRTFQDAIEFTRAMGVRHLWIDSLCIIQDEIDDWAIESAKMAEVYGCASLIIAAAASENSLGGLFEDVNNLKHFQPVRISSTGISDPVYCQGVPKFHGVRPKLMERGWAFQERVLAKRIVYFTKYELGWECKDAIVCECGDTEYYGAFGSRDKKGNLARGHLQDVSWGTFVKEYSSLELTQPSDRLPALSGIARAWKDQKVAAMKDPGDYCAGLWSRNLVQQLCWFTLNPRPCRHQEPTWSWASLAKPTGSDDLEIWVEREGEGAGDTVSIGSIDIKLATLNSFGAVSLGCLTLVDVPVFPATVTRKSDSGSEAGPIVVRRRNASGFPHLDLTSDRGGDYLADASSDQWGESSSVYLDVSGEVNEDHADLYCAKIRYQPGDDYDDDDGEDDEQATEYILLLKRKSDTSEFFSRVGLMILSYGLLGQFESNGSVRMDIKLV